MMVFETIFYQVGAFTYLLCFDFFLQVAHEIPAPDCEAFIELGTQTICDVAKAVSVIKQAENVYVPLITVLITKPYF